MCWRHTSGFPCPLNRSTTYSDGRLHRSAIGTANGCASEVKAPEAVCRRPRRGLALENGGPAIALQMLHFAGLDLVTATSDKPSPLGSKAILQPWMGEVFDTAYIPDRGAAP